MSLRWLLSLLCLAVLFLSLVQLTGARGELRVDETKSRILLDKVPAEVLLAIENPSTANVNANVHIEILDPRDKSIAKTTRVQTIAHGNQILRLSLPSTFSSSAERDRNRILWYRLHYRLSPQDSPAETLADGIISLSEMAPEVFALRVSAAEIVREGNRYRVRVQAIHPMTQQPVANVRIDAQLTLEGDDNKTVKLSGSKVTDAKGRALLDFELPPRFPQFPHHNRHAGGELEVTGTKGVLVVQAKGDVLVDQSARIFITTDKPLYQPGQIMHLRALLFTPSRQSALANHDAYFKICDPEGAVLYRTVVTTSRFGIASADWSIPENARLGDYRIWVGVDGGDDEQTAQDVRISRYELPNFKVRVDPDRKFYLPGQNATVTVRADYLFGQPLLRGKVRVVREAEREWNYRKQTWEVREEAEQKGKTNADGSFVARLDLSSYHKDLDDSYYRRFEDITFSAYFTDPTTNRTEQRRFDVRVTKDPIHVYVVENYDWSNSRELPLRFYVSTFYADGSPARCKVNVTFTDDADYPDIKKRVATITTNRYGLASISASLPKELADRSRLEVVLSASDSNGRKGSETENFYLDSEQRVRVETDKTIYRPGEPISAVITASGRDEAVVVDVAGEAGLIRSERVQLHGGRAIVTFPFRSEFKNTVSIVAFPESAKSRAEVGMRTVLYPYNSELNVSVRSARDTYRPGESAKFNVSVRSGDDRSRESALGVVVLDQAVLERFRTDREFGGNIYGFENSIEQFLGFENQLAGISLRDLQRLDTSQPVASDLDLLAAVLLRNITNYFPAFYSDNGEFEEEAAARLFGDSIAKQLKPLTEALTARYVRTMKYPADEAELRDTLSHSGIDFNRVRDPWGHPYSPTIITQSVYANRVRLENWATVGQTPSLRTNFVPVLQTVRSIELHSIGPDAKPRTSDDFSVATLTGIVAEQPLQTSVNIVLASSVVRSEANGSVVGLVTDPTGAVISGVTVESTQLPSGPTYETSTDENGKYRFASLPAAEYKLTFDAPGFKKAVITGIVVRANNITEVNVSLEPGALSETVTVAAAPASLETEQSTVGTSITKATTKLVTKSGSQQMSTPRLREYFPETLLWQPSIETDKNGRAQIDLKLADNITTWKMLVIGSTEDGRIGTTEKEIKAFQPFFVEHDPPRVLTEGDEISLPVVVRNYLPQAQKVNLEIKPESWFSLLGPAQKQTSVGAGDAQRETFDFRVLASVKDGKQRITARGSDENDAIEKPVTVHPDGEELSITAGDLLDTESKLEFEIRETMIPDSSRGELKIYPNLLAHVAEGVEAIMERPHGCGEQTISSTYPSLLLLRYYKKSGESFPLSGQAQRYLKDGYSRLLNYRAENGGFTYWGHGEPNLALTAYALQFLVDAGDVTSVDEDVLKQTREWLVKQQRPDGSWDNREAQGPALVLTAYIARVLARTDAAASEPLKRALDFLGRESQRNNEPYVLASYVLAAAGAKDPGRAKPALEKLRTLALEEGNTTYWTINTSTPFHGWGLAGSVETTALVVQAFAENCKSQSAGCDVDRKLINRGLLFLLKQKDRYGVWYSTQATVNVLDAMLLQVSNNDANNAAAQTRVDIDVNGKHVQTLRVNDRLPIPVTVDISQFLKVGQNRIDIRRPAGLPVASVQAVTNYYVPWTDSKRGNNGSNQNLRLQVKFDKTEAKINDEITCRVEAARVSGSGYGMMLAEIGIPPGAEVDRSSLQAAMKDWTITQYDVLPDRVVVYLWPHGSSVSFNFKFRPRFGMKAKTAASTLYDYYNPEASVTTPPSVFTVR